MDIRHDKEATKVLKQKKFVRRVVCIMRASSIKLDVFFFRSLSFSLAHSLPNEKLQPQMLDFLLSAYEI